MREYKKSFFAKLFKLKKKCEGENCNHVFKEGESYVVHMDFFTDFDLCLSCSKNYKTNFQKRIEEHRQCEEIKKRKDYEILAQEIIKLINIKFTSNN